MSQRSHPRSLPAEDTLLTREDFKRYVLSRANGVCVFCSDPAVDAHHVLERKLYPDTGGYFLGNGAAVCARHHWACESTALTVEQVRQAANIERPVLPPGFAPGATYDKWGNLVRDDGMRELGPLGNDDGMRKAIKAGGFTYLLLAAG